MQHFSYEKYQQIERCPHHLSGDAHGHIDGILKQPVHREPHAPRFYPEVGSFNQEGKGGLKGLSSQEVDTVKKLAQYTVGNTPTYYGEFAALECDRIIEFLVHYPWTEPRHGLLFTQAGKGQHLFLHNNT